MGLTSTQHPSCVFGPSRAAPHERPDGSLSSIRLMRAAHRGQTRACFGNGPERPSWRRLAQRASTSHLAGTKRLGPPRLISAAQELAERGFSVTVIDRDARFGHRGARPLGFDRCVLFLVCTCQVDHVTSILVPELDEFALAVRDAWLEAADLLAAARIVLADLAVLSPLT